MARSRLADKDHDVIAALTCAVTVMNDDAVRRRSIDVTAQPSRSRKALRADGCVIPGDLAVEGQGGLVHRVFGRGGRAGCGSAAQPSDHAQAT